VRIGVVAFGGHADVVQSPTLSRADVLAALDRLELQRFTAIGSGLLGALVTLIPTVDFGEGYDVFGPGRAPAGMHEAPLRGTHAAKRAEKPIQPGSYLSGAIILVSDGRGTMGISPAKVAKIAADLGVRVYTVGVGTLYGGVANVDGWPTIHAEFDEEILKDIADITRGEYFLARTAEKVTRIYDALGRRVIFETKEHEVTAVFAALGVIVSLAAAVLSLSWTR
jgi:Ca-activated chloride channel family protein